MGATKTDLFTKQQNDIANMVKAIDHPSRVAILQKGDDLYRHAINIGSVGKPKDGNLQGGYVLLHIRDHSSSTIFLANSLSGNCRMW